MLSRKKAAALPGLPGVIPQTYPTRSTTAPRARYRYPLKFWLPLRLAGYGLIALGVLNVVAGIRSLISLPGLSYYSAVVLTAALISFLASFAIGALIADILPSFEIRPDGLAVTEFARWRVVPWAHITRLHSLELPGERYVIFVEYAGRALSPEHVVYALLAGLGHRHGVFYMAAISDFDDLTRAILQARMRSTPGLGVEDLLAENVPMPALQMAFDPFRTMRRVAELPEDVSEPAEATAPTQRITDRAPLIRAQAALAAVPVVLFWIDNLVNGNIPFLNPHAGGFLLGTAGLIGLGLLELPFVALTIQALGENLLGEGQFETALRTYPYLELPRLLALVAVAAGVVIKAPFLLVVLCWLAGIGWTAYLTLRFTERLYRVPLNQAYLVAGASALVQVFVLLAYHLLRFAGLAVS